MPLAACSTGYAPVTSAVPLDPEYRSLLRDYLGPAVTGAQISSPRAISGWAINEPPVWVVCVKSSAGTSQIFSIEGNHVAPVVLRNSSSSEFVPSLDHPDFCEQESYEPL